MKALLIDLIEIDRRQVKLQLELAALKLERQRAEQALSSERSAQIREKRAKGEPFSEHLAIRHEGEIFYFAYDENGDLNIESCELIED